MAIGNPNCLNPEATASYAASLVKIVALPAGTFVVTPGALCGNLVTASYTYTPPFTQKASFFADFLPTWSVSLACASSCMKLSIEKMFIYAQRLRSAETRSGMAGAKS